MTQEELGRLVLEAFSRAMDNDADGAADALMQIGTRGDQYDVYGACCGLAEIGKAALKKVYGDRAPDPARGDMWTLEELQPGALSDDPPKAFAARFLIAYANGNEDSARALFWSALEAGGEQYVASTFALLADVVGIARLALNQSR